MTQFICLLGSVLMLPNVSMISLLIGRVDIVTLDTVCDLRVMIDAQQTMQVDDVASSCFYQLRQLRSI